jgi:hypothetical protein
VWDAEEAGPQPPSSSKGWVELSEDERAAARRLGYKRRIWTPTTVSNADFLRSDREISRVPSRPLKKSLASGIMM